MERVAAVLLVMTRSRISCSLLSYAVGDAECILRDMHWTVLDRSQVIWGSTTADGRVSIIRVMTCRLGRATAAEGHQFTLTDAGSMSAAATVPANSSQLTARSKPRVN